MDWLVPLDRAGSRVIAPALKNPYKEALMGGATYKQ